MKPFNAGEEKENPLINTAFDFPQLDESDRTGVIWVDDTTQPFFGRERKWSKQSIGLLLIGLGFIFLSIGSALSRQYHLKVDETKSNVNHDNSSSQEKRIRRLALLRPFGKKAYSSLLDSFVNWEEYLPCASKHQKYGVFVDIFLSFSQDFKTDTNARGISDELLDLFLENRNKNGWGRCFRNMYFIEANIPPSEDLYIPLESNTNNLWVNGPNKQFTVSMEQIIRDTEQYDAVLLIEKDTVPVKKFWLDKLLDEAESGDSFAILGSKYKGHAWDASRSSLPLALQHHFNGNALYNLTHPLMQKIVSQLREEGNTPYNAVPYDFRISQMIVEGMLGVKPDLPPLILKKWEETGHNLTSYSKRFGKWWKEYGKGKPMRESKVIANYVLTNLLPHHLQEESASLIHGATFYSTFDKTKQEITLVVSDWEQGLSYYLLHQIDSVDHPFSNLIILVPEDMDNKTISDLSSSKVKIDFMVQKRKHKDSFDICNADVQTEWFMITDSFHVVPDHIDMLFSMNSNKPVVPFIKADHPICASSPSCRESYEKSQKFDPNNVMIVYDSSILFQTKERNEFCAKWKNNFRERALMNANISKLDTTIQEIVPSATTYISYLSAKGSLNSIYDFIDQTNIGIDDSFKRLFTKSEIDMIRGKAPIANFLSEMLSNQASSTAKIRDLHRRYTAHARSPSAPTVSSPSISSPSISSPSISSPSFSSPSFSSPSISSPSISSPSISSPSISSPSISSPSISSPSISSPSVTTIPPTEPISMYPTMISSTRSPTLTRSPSVSTTLKPSSSPTNSFVPSYEPSIVPTHVSVNETSKSNIFVSTTIDRSSSSPPYLGETRILYVLPLLLTYFII